MTKLFMAILSLSLSGTLIGLTIAATHPITKKYFTKRWNYYIWLLVVVKLMLPFQFVTALSGGLNWQIDLNQPKSGIDNNLKQISTISADSMPIVSDSSSAVMPPSSDTSDNTADFARTNYGKDNTQITAMFLTIFAYLWFFGAITAVSLKLINYRRFKVRIKKDCVRITDSRVTLLKSAFCAELHIDDVPSIYESSLVSSPMTIGLWNPVIVIPKAFSEKLNHDDNRGLAQLQLVLHHELVHVTRKDLLYKWIYQTLLCIHWFNPVLYRIGRQINSDCELSCDEAILANLTETGKQMYGNVLLDTAAQGIDCGRNAFSTTLLENKKDLKQRLDNILHYKKTTYLRLALSICTMLVMLTVSACSTIWISPDAVSESKHNDSVSKTFASDDRHSDSSSQTFDNQETEDSDEPSLFMKVLTSMVSADSFTENFSKPDRTSDAWKVYDDDRLLAGEDIQDNWTAYNYYMSSESHKQRASGFVLYGSDTFIIAYADKDVEVTLTSSFILTDGKFKIVYVAPDQSVLTLNDTGAETTQTITMKKGRNVLKMVGQGARLKNLEMDYSDIRKSDFERIYYSEGEEYSYHIKDSVIAGEPFKKDKILDALYHLEEDEASDVFNALLTAGTAFTTDELIDFFIYSDKELSSRYLLEAVQSGNINLDADAISELMPYIADECHAELLMQLPIDEFYDVFEENICYMNSTQIKSCLDYYINAGGKMSYSQFDEISPYLHQ